MANEDVEKIIEMACGHGEMSEPEMEVGDLQQALRIVWRALTGYQQEVLLVRVMNEVFTGEDWRSTSDLTLEPKPDDGSGSVRS
jgi:hypothetical protein